MQAVGTWKRGYETLLEDDHAHTVMVDLPIDEGGRSAGPAPLDLTLLSLAGSITTTFAVLAEKRRLPFYGLSVALEADRPHRAPTLSRVRGTVRVRTKTELAEVATVLRSALKACPVAAIFEQAHIPVEVVPIVMPTVPTAGTVAASR